MKKFSYILFIIFFISSINPSLATGVQVHPQSEDSLRVLPMTSPLAPTPLETVQPIVQPPVKVPAQPPTQNIFEPPLPAPPQVIFQEPLSPIIQPKKPVDLNSEKVLEATAEAEIPTYQKISLPDAINYALSHNLDIKGNRLNTDIAKNDIKTANRLRNPYIMSFFNTGKAALDNPNSLGLVFPIDIMKRGPRKNLAKSNYELTKGTVALAEFNLRMDVRAAYINLVASKSVLKILNDHRKLLQELLDVAQRKYDVGAAPLMDVIQAKMTLNQLLIEVNSANTNVYSARYEFNRVLNSCNYDSQEDYLPEQQDVVFLLTPQPVEKMPEFNELLNVAFEKRLDLKNAQKAVDVAQKNLVTVVRQRVPDIEIGGGVLNVPEQNSSIDQTSNGLYFVGNITNIPLLYQYSPEIKNAKLMVEQKQLAYCSLRNQSVMDLHTAYDEFNTAKDNLNYYNDILLSESLQFLNMAKTSYKVGKSNITDFIFVQQSYKTIITGYTAALEYYYNSWANIIREVNDEELKLHG